ncbi:hypothetical protein [Chondrinema litorale]|uniref:hypothetical protein n=1 Tax=Chondrinema litorale TaxID=2994555 RepID=UPI0025432FE7|nr:hypothetical protein [Chondrinema litorale]UZR95497.1 hypothetical protein OQ292_06685 [Chondrinema litorale]
MKIISSLSKNVIFKRLINGLGVGVIEQILNVIIQVVSIPMFLHAWGKVLYGEWLVLYTFPMYLTISDLGFSKAAINSMTMSFAKKDWDSVNRYFNSCLVLLAVVGFFLLLLIMILMKFLPLISILNFHLIHEFQIIKVVITFTFLFLIHQQNSLLTGALTCSGRFAKGVSIQVLYKFIEFIIIVIMLSMSASVEVIALIYLLSAFLRYLHLNFEVREKKYSWLVIGVSGLNLASFKTIRELASPALAFMLGPIGNALRNQVPLFFISSIIGPSFVVMYTTMRTITNIGIQFIGLINRSISPEYARAFGEDNIDLLKKLYLNACRLAFWGAFLLSLFLGISGKYILLFWTEGKIDFNYILFYTFLLSLIVNSLWLSSFFLTYSINKHKRQSVEYVISCLIGIIITFLILLSTKNVSFAAIGILISDFLILTRVIKINTKFLNQTFWEILKSTFVFSFKI